MIHTARRITVVRIESLSGGKALRDMGRERERTGAPVTVYGGAHRQTFINLHRLISADIDHFTTAYISRHLSFYTGLYQQIFIILRQRTLTRGKASPEIAGCTINRETGGNVQMLDG